MKKILALLLCAVMLLSLAACAGDEMPDNAEQKKSLEKVFGDVTALPMELDTCVERLGDKTMRGMVETTDEEVSYEIIIGAYSPEAEVSPVLMAFSYTSEAELSTGETYPMTTRGLIVGTAESGMADEYKLHFVGGNFEASVEAEDAQSVFAQLAADMEAGLATMEDSELSEEDLALYLALARGEKVWISSDSAVWEGLELYADAKVSYDTQNRTFQMMKIQPNVNSGGELVEGEYRVRTFDSNGRLETETYTSPNTGMVIRTWRYSYPSDGVWERYGTEDHGIAGTAELYECYHGKVDGEGIPQKDGKAFKSWEKYYNVDGSLESEEADNEDGTRLQTYYDENGAPRSKTMLRWESWTGEDGMSFGASQIIIWEEQYENGVLAYRVDWSEDQATKDVKEYSREGEIVLESHSHVEWIYTNPGGSGGVYPESYPLWEKVYKGGTLYSYTEYKYDENWELLDEKTTYYDENGNEI